MNDLNNLLIETMKENFGYTSFREGQKEIVEEILSRNDVLGVLPTGTGKSMCYQLPSVLLDGLTVVVSPLISLMIDQVKQLKAKGFKRVTAINSLINKEQKQAIIQNLHQYKIIYVSPEMLQNETIFNELKKQTVTLFVIDEAHCISQWGHEFRTDYLKLHNVINELRNPIVLALSATATPQVQQDIKYHLNRPHMINMVYPMDRENIGFVVEKVEKWSDKVNRIIEILEANPMPTMIYFSSRLWCERVSRLLNEKLSSLRVAHYHGGMDREDRLLIQQQFMNNQLDVICCTSAFGMGVDKPNVRLVIHFHLPSQIESYIQEVGRAGRDGKQSVGLVLYSDGDEQITLSLIEQELPSDNQIYAVFQYLEQNQGTLNFNTLDRDFFIQETLNETQWRFLAYQLELNDIVHNGEIVSDETKWREVLQNTLNFKQKRLNYKVDMFYHLVKWINGTSCRRKNLFESFQEGYKRPAEICCDQCGDVFKYWNPETVNLSESFSKWEDQLNKLFQVR